jgi:type II secretory pathway pseudopilin PulG
MKNKFSITGTRSAFQFDSTRSCAVSSGARGSAPQAAAAAAFTLVELLIVIATIGILAAFLIPVFGSVSRHAVIQRAQSEREQIETAIQNYYSYYGFYPPGNAAASAQFLPAALTNQLYYELEGTTPNVSGSNTNYTTLDSASSVLAPTVKTAFGVSSFMNYTRGNTEDSKPAKDFLQGLPAARMATLTVGANSANLLVTAANSDDSYQPLPGVKTAIGRNANPWRYLCPGINNPQSYDLWVQIFIGGKTNLICNWKPDQQINSPLP